MDELREFTVSIGGRDSTFQLTRRHAERLKLDWERDHSKATPAKKTTPRNKAVKPANK